jgi:ribonuclease T
MYRSFSGTFLDVRWGLGRQQMGLFPAVWIMAGTGLNRGYLGFGNSAVGRYPARMNEELPPCAISTRFRGFLPVVVDVETAGFDPQRHALLEIAAVVIRMDPHGVLSPGPRFACHVLPFIGAEIDPRALAFNGIDPDHPFRDAVAEHDALVRILGPIRKEVAQRDCNRAILVGHNAHFDLSFLKAAVERTGFRRNPFHAFSVFDTVTLAGLAYGQTVLAKAARAAGLGWDDSNAHSAIYDADQTARLFCNVANRWRALNLTPDG